jgi:hypothetical protein
MNRLKGLVTVGLVLLPHLALAQPEEDPRKTARMHFGPLYLTPIVTLTNLGWDSNVFNGQGEAKEGDFTFTLTPAADVWLPFARRAMIITNAAADLVYFQTLSSERSVDPFVLVRPEIYFNRLTLFAEGSYLDTRQRPNFEIDVRARRNEREGKAGFDLRIAKKLSIEMAGRERRIRFDADQYYQGTELQETLNRDERAASATLRYRWTPLTTVVVLSEAQSDRFVYSPERDTDSVRIMPGVELKPRAIVSGSGYIGYRRFVVLSDEMPDFSGLVASGALSYTLQGATKFTFTANRDVDYSFEQDQPYYVKSGFGLDVRRALGARFDVTAGYERYDYAYREFTTGTATPTVHRVDLTQDVSCSFGYRAARDARIGFGASYRERTSNTEPFRDYNGVRIGVMIDYGLSR